MHVAHVEQRLDEKTKKGRFSADHHRKSQLHGLYIDSAHDRIKTWKDGRRNHEVRSPDRR